jgi:hypothetical protein
MAKLKAPKVAHEITPDSFAPLPGAADAENESDAGRGEEPGRPVPRGESAAATPGNGATLLPASVKNSKGIVYIPLKYVAAACGLEAYEVHNRLRPDHWGSPGHFQFVADVCLYNEAKLDELAAAFAAAGLLEAAARLRDFAGMMLSLHKDRPAAVKGHGSGSGAKQHPHDFYFREGQYE